MLSNWLNSDATLTRDEADGVVVPGPTAEAEAAAAEAEADALAKAEALAKATAALGSLRSALDQAQVELAEQLEATARERALKEGAVAERESLRVQLEAAADERERRAKELFSARAELEATAAALRGSKASLEATRRRMTETQVAAAEALAATERERDGARAALRVTQRELASTSAALDSTMLQLLELQRRPLLWLLSYAIKRDASLLWARLKLVVAAAARGLREWRKRVADGAVGGPSLGKMPSIGLRSVNLNVDAREWRKALPHSWRTAS